MTTISANEPFSFETSQDSLEGLPVPRPMERSTFGFTEDQLFIAFALVGGACLFWRYSVALGAFLLAMTTFVWAMRERAREMRRRLAPLREPPQRISIRVTDAGYSQRGEQFFAETSWKGVINGFERDGYLLVQGWRVPRVYLPVEEMKRAGVYDQIKSIVDELTVERQAARAKAGVGPST